MELHEIGAILEKIWELHDKLSDAIHTISRTHFLNSVRSMRKSDEKKLYSDIGLDENQAGFVFVKEFQVDDGDDSAIQEAKSLNAIRTALESLEDQLEFFHTVQAQQRVERDAALARLEQSRIVLAMRLAEHHGKKYEVIEEALAFVGGVHDPGRIVSPENLYGSPNIPSNDNFASHEGKRSNILVKVLLSGLNFAKTSLKLDHMGGILGNAALFAMSMLAFLHLHQVTYNDKFHLDHPQKQEDNFRKLKKTSQREGSSYNDHFSQLDVFLARG